MFPRSQPEGRNGNEILMTFHRLTKNLFPLAVALALYSAGAKADSDVSTAAARPSPDWLRSGVIYEIFPRDFSPAGNLAGVTGELDFPRFEHGGSS